MAGQYPGQFGPPPGPVLHSGTEPGGYAVAAPPTAPAPLAPPVGPYGTLGRVLCVLAPLLTVGLLGMVPSLLLAVRRRRVFDIVGAVLFGVLFLTFLICMGLGSGKGEAQNTADAIGMVTMVLLWIGAPVHYLVLDRREVWSPAAQPAPSGYVVPSATPLPAHTVPLRAQTAGGYAPSPAATHTPPPVPGQAVPPVSVHTPPPAVAYTPPPAGVRTPSPAGAYTPPPVGHTPPPAPAYPSPPAPAAGAAQPSGATPGLTPAPTPAPPADDLRELGELLRRQAREGQQ